MSSAPENSNNFEPTLSRRGLFAGAFAVTALTLVGCEPGTSPTKSATPSPEKPKPSPSESVEEELPTLESQMDDATEILELPHKRFDHRDMQDRQLAIDSMFLRILTDDGHIGTPFTKYGHPDDPRMFAEPEGRDLSDFSPLLIAATGEDNKQATAQEILNQLVFAKAAIFSQQEDPEDINNLNLDQNTAANMVSGYYYDHEGPEAKALAERALKSVKALVYGPKHYVKPDAILSSSDTFKEHDFGLGDIEYKVINYTDGSNRKYVIVSPVETTFTGPDPTDPSQIIEFAVTKWLVVGEGKGEEDTEGSLRNYN